jgi:hypothetical protein
MILELVYILRSDLRLLISDFFLCNNSPKWRYYFFGGNLWRFILTFLVDEIARLLTISRWYPSFLDENTQIWMNNCTFIHNLDVSSTHIDEGGSCTVVKIASPRILIIEKKSLLLILNVGKHHLESCCPADWQDPTSFPLQLRALCQSALINHDNAKWNPCTHCWYVSRKNERCKDC